MRDQAKTLGRCSSTKFQKINFSGIWKVDSLKSNFGRFVVPVTLKIVQTTDTISTTETWTLSPDRRTLTIDRVIANDGEGGHGVSKAVYNRQ